MKGTRNRLRERQNRARPIHFDAANYRRRRRAPVSPGEGLLHDPRTPRPAKTIGERCLREMGFMLRPSMFRPEHGRHQNVAIASGAANQRIKRENRVATTARCFLVTSKQRRRGAILLRSYFHKTRSNS